MFESVSTDFVGVAFGVALVALLWLAPRGLGNLVVKGVPVGIVSFEMAGTSERATEILDSWRDTGKRKGASAAMRWDFFLIAAYVVFLVLGCVLATRFLASQADAASGRVVVALGLAFLGLSIATGLFDVVEDIALLRILSVYAPEVPRDTTSADRIGAWARAARLCASLKFGCLIVVLLFLAWAAGLALWQELSS